MEHVADDLDFGDLPSYLAELCCSEEKACLGRTVYKSTHFNHVYSVCKRNGVYVPHIPEDKSPSKPFKENPSLHKAVCKSTFRLLCVHNNKGSDKEEWNYGTAFAVSKNMALTAGHVLLNRKDQKLSFIKSCSGTTVNDARFIFEGFDCKQLECYYKKREFKDDEGPLPTKGFDFGFVSSSKKFEFFLLPCSPSYFQGKIKVSIFSYPAVTKFLEKLYIEASDPNCSSTDIWDCYSVIMQDTIKQNQERLASSKGVEEVDVSAEAIKESKKSLYTMLKKTFSDLSTGQLICSVGLCSDFKDCFGSTSCSTLSGSSGSAVCPTKSYHHTKLWSCFFGIHIARSKDADLNLFTSCDNLDFVDSYILHVLPTLPLREDSFWDKFHLNPFIHWLEKHKDKVQDPRWIDPRNQTSQSRRRVRLPKRL